MKLPRLLIVLSALALTACATPAPAGPFHWKGGGASPAPTVPAWVTASGNEVAYALLAAHPGPIGTLLTPTAYCVSIGGCSGGLANGAGSFDITTTHTINGVDFTNKGVFVTGASTVATLTNVHLQSNGSGYTFNPTANSGGAGTASAGANLDHFEVDGSSNINVGEAPFFTGVGTYSHGYFHNIGRDVFDTFINGWTVDSSYFSMWAQFDPVTSHHAEAAHIRSSGTFSNNYVNADDGNPAVVGQTGTLFIDSSAAGAGAITFNLTHNILTGNDTQSSTQPGGTVTQGIGPPIVCKAIADITINADHQALSPAVTGTLNWSNLNVVGRLNYTVTSGTFNKGDGLVGGTSGATAKFDSAETVPGTALIIIPSTGNNWSGHFTAGEVVTDQSTGATATLTAAQQGTCIINDLGGNVNKNTGLGINLAGRAGF